MFRAGNVETFIYEENFCVSGAVNTQGFVWKFFTRYI